MTTFEQACREVAADWRALAYAIRKDDNYASHVTEETKEQELQRMLTQADDIETGKVTNFTIAQRVHYKMTGECVPFLPNPQTTQGEEQ